MNIESISCQSNTIQPSTIKTQNKSEEFNLDGETISTDKLQNLGSDWTLCPIA